MTTEQVSKLIKRLENHHEWWPKDAANGQAEYIATSAYLYLLKILRDKEITDVMNDHMRTKDDKEFTP